MLLAKPGLDGHDRGIKVIAMALRDAGAEVIYLGLRRSVAEIVQAAADDDADVIGISVLSGAHLPLAEQLLRERDARGLSGVPVVLGGTIPPADADALRALGVTEVFPVGTNLLEVCEALLRLATGTRASAMSEAPRSVTTDSGVPVVPVYTRPTSPAVPSVCRSGSAFPGRPRSRAGHTHRCTEASCGRCASSPASVRRRRRTSGTDSSWIGDRRRFGRVRPADAARLRLRRPMARAEVGRVGVAIDTAEDMVDLFQACRSTAAP